MAKFHVIPLRSLSTFLAVKALVLWLTEPFPNMPLIVLSNKHILHILYTDFTAPKGVGFCYFPESNAKALSTGYALSKVPLRPAGFSVLSDGMRLFASLLFPPTPAFPLSEIH